MLREQRGSTPLSAKANGLSGVDMTRPETTKNGGVKDENMTPNHCQNDVQIKAWQGRRQSSIPSPPNAEAVAVTPKHGVDEVRDSLRIVCIYIERFIIAGHVAGPCVKRACEHSPSYQESVARTVGPRASEADRCRQGARVSWGRAR